jgi:hypothetical protein
MGTQYNPSWSDQFEEGFCESFNAIDIGTGNCSQYEASTPTPWDIWSTIVLNWTGVYPGWDPILTPRPANNDFLVYYASVNMASVLLGLLFIPPSIIISGRLLKKILTL